ncbi:hypothetical protein DFH08DRAFT_804288 [Mycena albidolilacea]|uniref:Uncharacterized protein n=1 Tax=Mycena albidolilacea TaxID=1033008 RepID=A0AAD7ABM0_9AGAR|nr:hypothetical protein DFH08DRAFT_804288 [Mycena albidolilacea]
MNAEREEESKTGQQTKRERRREEQRRGMNEDGWGLCNHRSGIEEGNHSQVAAVICTRRCWAECTVLLQKTIAQCVAAWSVAVGQLSLGFEVTPFSEIVLRWHHFQRLWVNKDSEVSSVGWAFGWEGRRAEDKGRMGGLWVQSTLGISGADLGSQSNAACWDRQKHSSVNGSAWLRWVGNEW